ncbi:dihydrolipoyl dehydrogenase family protein [Anaerotignum sp.]|uniref:dihydrolipoyl dehydrogenase family protein n=1 Tax=Anaerotignum sp. TaxID=2039241 RepID=UPI00289BC9E7|nr:dihydrolipoyl dehydrogenase [Anaerotignum sp.]
MKRFDIVIVGSGAGLMVMEAALNKGLSCAIIEKAKFGGTCLTKGCIPSKMLVYPADFIREAEESERIGIRTPRPEIDWDSISKRMWEQIDFSKSIENSLQGIPNLTVYKGSGAFTGPNSMVISCEGKEDELIYGDKFIIAVGARTMIPPVDGLENTGYMTSETFFGEKFPKKLWKSLAIIGGGAISAEFAHIFSAFGTKVTIIARSKILNKEEEEVAQFVSRKFIKNGIDVLSNSKILSVYSDDGKKYITIENTITNSQIVVECEEILVASGVKSNADTLALEKAGVEVDKHGWISTNPYLETSNKNVWALGDINGKYQFRHKANYEAQVLVHNLFSDGNKKELRYDTVPWAIFTHPQVAHVGMTEKEAKDKGLSYRTAKNHYSEVVGGRAMGYRDGDDDNGFVKMIIGADKKIFGVHIVGPQAAVLLQPFVYLMNVGYQCTKTKRALTENGLDGLRILCPNIDTYEPINDSMVIHPSLNELTAWVFEKLNVSE